MTDRLMNNFEYDTNGGCWLWIRTLSASGYGRYGHRAAHREVYTRLRGPIPEGLQLDHLCRVRCCVNPDHLEPVTGKENLHRSPNTNATKTHCAQGHPFTPENTYLSHYMGKTKRACRACGRASGARRYRQLCDAKRAISNE